MYNIEKYWTRRLGRSATTRESALKGWVGNPVPIPSFVEPALTVREGDPDNADIIIVAAPGAVGKTTFAQALARTSGFAYVDLAQTSPLGGNFFTGGLTNAFGFGALQEAANGSLGIIVDGLDEAQLRATPEGFAAGLADLATIVRASSRVLPPVLFGRSLAADEAWLTLNSAGRRPCIFEIEFFDDQRAEQYLAARLQALAEASPRTQSAFSRHRDRFVALAHETRARLAAAGGDTSARFTGYAPILDAICSFALDEDELNPQSKFSRLDGETQVELVNDICTAVLKREQSKLLAQLADVCPPEHRSSIETLYDPDNQRARLSSALFGAPAPKFPTLPTPTLSQAFANMVQQFFPIHPFLDGSRTKAANAVFAADILVSSLLAPDRKEAARRAARDDQRLMTGVVFDLYAQHLKLRPLSSLPLADVGILYEALKAQIGSGHRATLEIDQPDDDAPTKLEVVFEVVQKVEQAKAERSYGPYFSDPSTSLELRTPMTGVSIDAPIWATLGDGSGLLVEAPCEVQVQTLTISAQQVFIQGSPDDSSAPLPAAVFIAEEADVNSVQAVTASRVNFSVTWPFANQHPWTNFAADPIPVANPDIAFMRRRLRKILTAFRSHSKGKLVRYAPKIDHLRMTKDRRGTFLVDQLLGDRVLSSFDGGRFYLLEPDRMAGLMNIDYFRLQQQQFTKECDAYLEHVLAKLPQTKIA